MRKIRLTESQFNRLVSRCVQRILKEQDDEQEHHWGTPEKPYNMDKVRRWAKKNGFYEENGVIEDRDTDLITKDGVFVSSDENFPMADLHNYLDTPDNYDLYGNSKTGIQKWAAEQFNQQKPTKWAQKLAPALYDYLQDNRTSELVELSDEVAEELGCKPDDAFEALTTFALQSYSLFDIE